MTDNAPPTNFKEYIGDSVYVNIGTFQGEVVLTTENGYPEDPSNEIIMDPYVVQSLVRWLKRTGNMPGE